MFAIALLTALQWLLAAFCQSAFYHRFSSHKYFAMNRLWERCFFILTWLSIGPGYMTAWKYATMHIQHHLHTDEKGDPHSEVVEGNVFAMMWNMVRFNIALSRHTPEELVALGWIDQGVAKIMPGLPRWDAFEHVAASYPVRATWVFIYMAIYSYFGIDFIAKPAWLALLFVNVYMGPIHGFIINYLAHKLGYRNYETKDTSTNFPLLPNLLLGGEGYHNNHHALQGRPEFAHLQNEIDTTYMLLELLQILGIISIKNVPPLDFAFHAKALKDRMLRELYEGKAQPSTAELA